MTTSFGFGLTTVPHDPVLDLDPWVGQRQETYRFHRVHGVTGENLGDLHPYVGSTLNHDASATIPRRLDLVLGVEDTAAVDPLVERVDVFMVFPGGVEYPLGRYMYTDASHQITTAGEIGTVALTDEMFIIDQEIEEGVSTAGKSCEATIQGLLSGFDFHVVIEPSLGTSTQSWTVGTSRGSVLQALALAGGYFNPWFGNDGQLHFVQAFNPASRVPDFDWDRGNQVVQAGITETSDILTAPNRFVVISNNPSESESPVVGVADIPASAPHSFANRGFRIIQTTDIELADVASAQAVAQAKAERDTVFETTTLTTAPDPRHDSWQVVRWRGELWLELGWTLQLEPGGAHTHVLRKGYAT